MNEFTGFEDVNGNKIYVGDTVNSLLGKIGMKIVKEFEDFCILNIRNELIPLKLLNKSLKHKNRLMYRKVK